MFSKRDVTNYGVGPKVCKTGDHFVESLEYIQLMIHLTAQITIFFS